MFEKIPDFTNSIFIGTILILLLSGFIVINLVFYYFKVKKHLKDQEALKTKFQIELIQTQIEVQEQTRKNLASELHDNIGQLLSLTNVTLASINLTDLEKAAQKIADTQILVTKSIKELRQLSKIIHGEQLIQQGLIETIEQEINWLKRNEQFLVIFEHRIADLEIARVEKDLFIYRLLQECLNNIIKHSGANQIEIQLVYTNQTMCLRITDNGVGFNYSEVLKKSNGLGLANMQKRIDLLKGSFKIDSIPHLGTTLEFSIPYENS